MVWESVAIVKIEGLVVGQLRTNCYVLTDGDECIIVDPGGDHLSIADYLTEHSLSPTMILATHGHFDHILSVNELKMRFGIPFMVSKNDINLVTSLPFQVKTYLDLDIPTSPVPDNYLVAGEKLFVGKESILIVETPGHTSGSCSFIFGNNILSGDFIFAGSIGRTDIGGSMMDMSRSLKWLNALPGDYNIFPGHGNYTTLGAERNTNPFLRGL